MGSLFTRRTKLPLSWHIYLRHLKFRSSLFKGLRIPKAEPLVGFKGEALNLYCLLSGELCSPLNSFVSNISHLSAKNVKGVALKTYEGLRP